MDGFIIFASIKIFDFFAEAALYCGSFFGYKKAQPASAEADPELATLNDIVTKIQRIKRQNKSASLVPLTQELTETQKQALRNLAKNPGPQQKVAQSLVRLLKITATDKPRLPMDQAAMQVPVQPGKAKLGKGQQGTVGFADKGGDRLADRARVIPTDRTASHRPQPPRRR